MAARRQSVAPEPKIPKLDEAQRGAVARALRKVKDDLSEVTPALKFITDAVMEGQLNTNEELAELEEMFDIIRDAAKDIPYKTTKEKAEILLLAQLDDRNLPKFTVAGAGTITKTKKKYWSMKDPEKLIEFIKKDGTYDCFTTAVAEKWCNAYLEEHKKVPPGCDYWEKTSLSFTKEKPKKGKK